MSAGRDVPADAAADYLPAFGAKRPEGATRSFSFSVGSTPVGQQAGSTMPMTLSGVSYETRTVTTEGQGDLS